MKTTIKEYQDRIAEVQEEIKVLTDFLNKLEEAGYSRKIFTILEDKLIDMKYHIKLWNREIGKYTLEYDTDEINEPDPTDLPIKMDKTEAAAKTLIPDHNESRPVPHSVCFSTPGGSNRLLIEVDNL